MVEKTPKIIKIRSDKNELTKVELFLKQFFIENSVEDKYFNIVFLCISEAVINSIEHGNRNDMSKEVSVVADCEHHAILVKIKDEGEGFDLASVPDPTKPENLMNESGRGIHIIRSLAEHVDYHHNEISIQFKIDCK